MQQRPKFRTILAGARVFAALLLIPVAGDATLAQQTKPQKPPAEPVAQATALVGGTVIDGRGGAPVENGAVVFQDGRIIAVGPAAAVKIPAGARVITTAGKTVLPGLIDAHMHIGGSGGGSADPREFTPQAASNNFRSYLKHGVTSVFDIAGNPFLDAQKQALASGQMLGPRLFGVKYAITAPGSHPMGLLAEYKLMDLLGPVYLRVATADEARAAIAKVAADGTDGVKIMNSRSEFPGTSRYDADRPKLSPELLKVLIDAAHAAGLKAFVHVAFPSEAREAVEAGADALAHSIGMAETGTEAVFAEMARRGTGYIPTLAQIEAVYRLRTDPDMLQEARGRVWDVILDSFEKPGSLVLKRLSTPGLAADARRNLEISMANLRRAVRAGVTIVLGTDSGNAGTLHGATVAREMELMNRSGMTQMEIIVAATAAAAALIGQGDELGTLEVGKRADIAVVDGNPLVDISVMRRVTTVVRGGYVLDPAGIPFE